MTTPAMHDETDAQAHARLREYLLVHGLKASRQREIIADVFFAAHGHLRVEELLERARAIDGKVSQATVYRTMKLLTACGLASARHFFDGQTRYERTDAAGEHHDHLICTQCGTIVEFVDPRIERLQDKVAAANGFVVTDHKMELYGLCANCQTAAAAARSGG
jgi:Fur family ferric uptake transcriptional regulator